MKSQQLICTNCKNNFNYPNKEFNRRFKKGITEFFCSLSCSCSYRNRTMSSEQREKLRLLNIGNKYGRKNKKGEFTYYLNKSRNRQLKRLLENTDLDEEYLKSIWTGFCNITKIPIKLKNCKGNASILDASLDRIDSSKGYIKGNVQFVALGINYAKNSFSDEEVKEFLALIRGTST